MPAPPIRYRSGYKYQLHESYSVVIRIKPPNDIATEFVGLGADGRLSLKKGYAWDGPSGLIDTDRNMRASVVHDGLYQLMRMEELSEQEYRDAADSLFGDMCHEDGVPLLLAKGYAAVLKQFGGPAADPANAKEVHEAP